MIARWDIPQGFDGFFVQMGEYALAEWKRIDRGKDVWYNKFVERLIFRQPLKFFIYLLPGLPHGSWRTSWHRRFPG